MPHFGEDPIADDPELVRALRRMLRGQDAPPRPPPSARERFGVRSAPETGGEIRGKTRGETRAETDRDALLCVGPRPGPG